MNLGVLIIIAATMCIVLLIVLPRVRGFGRNERTTVERRSGPERRRRKVTVARNRRKRARRAEDAARAFVEKISE